MPLPPAPTKPADTVNPSSYGEAAPSAAVAPSSGSANKKTVKSRTKKLAAPSLPEAPQANAAQKAAPAADSAKKTAAKPAAKRASQTKAKTARTKTAAASRRKSSDKQAPRTQADMRSERAEVPITVVPGASRLRKPRATAASVGPRVFVLDTNVLLHDPTCLFRFEEHDVFLPMTTLEELDNHKKGLTDVARNARSVSRTLDALIEANDGQIREGVPLALLGNAEARGRLWFETEPLEAELPAMLPTFKGDNSILATVKGVQEAFPERAAVLVSKDINMRIKATTLGIPAEDYFSDKALDDTDMLYTGRLLLEADFWEKTAPTLRSWQDAGATHYEFEAEDPSRFIVNECLAIDGDEGFMAIVTDVSGKKVTMRLLRDYRAKGRFKVWGIHARNREQNMALNLLMDPEIDFVAILGQAGTGKTLMTLAAALAQTIDERRFSEIIVTRATVSVGEDIGFLPGTEEEKMAPWMGALEDNLEVLHRTDSGGEWGRQASLDLIKSRIRIKSMSFMRGRTFLQKFVIIDEAQNLSPKQMKTLITRAGPGTKIVCLGNIAQIDTPYLTEGSSGLTYVVERFQGWPHAATITLTRGERSRLAEFAAEAL